MRRKGGKDLTEKDVNLRSPATSSQNERKGGSDLVWLQDTCKKRLSRKLGSDLVMKFWEGTI